MRSNRGFTALRIEGGILPPEFLQDIAMLKAPRQFGPDYGLSKSLSVKEEIARYWRIGSDLYGRYFERRPRTDIGESQVGIEDWLIPFFRSLLGYDDLTVVGNVQMDDQKFKLTHHAFGGAVPLLLVTHSFDLDQAYLHFGQDNRRKAPHGLMQEYLNAEDSALWGIVSNGSKFRILRNNTSLTRPAFIEADLDLLFAEELYSDFSALWLTAHSSRLKPIDDKPSGCIIESWRAKAHEQGQRVRENLRDGVTESLRQLGTGFLENPENKDLRKRLEYGTLSTESYFQQLLRLVYRLLFLSVAEDRDLLHAPDATDGQRMVFAEGYSLARLRERTLRRRHYDRKGDLWQGLLITFGALARGATGLGLPPLGGLFRDDQCPDLDSSFIANKYLLAAVRTVAFFQSDKSLARINYRDMDTEELGSVYESLLELHPIINVKTSPWNFAFVGDGSEQQVKGSARKLTGSYYTPPTLVRELITSTLDPVIQQAVTSRPNDPRDAILALNVVDPACGSGHFLLAAARRLAIEIVRIESGDDSIIESSRQHALREVVQHCIYGVDRNPLAVELCRTALWMETLEPGKPLTFLDSHIRQGDSLMGILDPEIMATGIPDDAYKALTGDDKVVCRDLKKRNQQPNQGDLFDQDAVLEVAVTSIDIDEMPEDTLDEVEHKRAMWKTGLDDPIRARETLRANLYLGAYFMPKTHETIEVVPQTQDLQRLESGRSLRHSVGEVVDGLSDTYNFFHWHLAFADVMQDGGFDVVLGNPPWERIKLQEKEFFASCSSEIVNAPNKAARERLIRQLNRDEATPADKALYRKFKTVKREVEAVSKFARTGRRFPLTGVGDLNTYAVFAETFLQLVNPSGRAGLILPTGIATDHSTKAYFNHIISQRRLVSLFDFENRKAIFSSIDSRMKFCLMTLSGENHPILEAEFAFFLHQTEQLKEAERRFTLSESDFYLFNPNTRTCPIFRTRYDIEIARKMYRRAGVFWKEAIGEHPEDNPWGVSFQLMFSMSSDSGLFANKKEMEDDGWKLNGNVFVRGEERYLPLYEAKLFHQYDHRFATFDGVSERDVKNGNARTMTSEEKADIQAVVLPRYWVPELEVIKKFDMGGGRAARISHPHSTLSSVWHATRFQENHQRNQRKNGGSFDDNELRFERFRNNNFNWFVAFRDIARATDQRTAIFVVVRGTAMNNKAPLLKIDWNSWLQAFRGITHSTNERSIITNFLPRSGVGNSAPIIDYENARAVAATLVLANMNSLPFDWAARLSVGGSNLNFYIVKQLPVLPPEDYLKESSCGYLYVQLVVPRVLELTYTSIDVKDYANDLGYQGPPFPWDEERRHCLRCELDAIFAHMYGLNRSDIEWILDAPAPSSSFPTLKQNELKEFGEFRTQRYVLNAFDTLERGRVPNLQSNS